MNPEELFAKLNDDMLALKESDPAKYLELLKGLNQTLEELQKDLSEV